MGAGLALAKAHTSAGPALYFINGTCSFIYRQHNLFVSDFFATANQHIFSSNTQLLSLITYQDMFRTRIARSCFTSTVMIGVLSFALGLRTDSMRASPNGQPSRPRAITF
jgi:hypothetical protein